MNFYIYFLSYFYVPSALGIAALSPIILNLLGGSQYMGGVIPLRIIMFSTAFFISQNILSQVVASVRRTWIFMFSSGVALLANVIFSIFLIPKFGLVGAALGFSSVYAVTFMVLEYFALKEKIAEFDLSGLIKVWVSALVMFLVVDIISNFIGLELWLLPLYIVMGALVYFVMSKGLGVFRKESNELILSLFPVHLNKIRKFIYYVLLSR